MRCHLIMIPLLIGGCLSQPVKDPEPEQSRPERLIRTICKECPCQSVETIGDDVTAKCYKPVVEEKSTEGQKP